MKRYHPLARLYHATRFSLAGIRCAFRQEQSFEHETVVLAVLVAVVLWANVSWPMAFALVGCWLLVMILELVNSALERAFDLIDGDYNVRIKEGKDMLSASVFLAVLFNVALWAVCALRWLYLVYT